jgi:uncharacterized protein with von Willebrand factor type A (vWA) domain
MARPPEPAGDAPSTQVLDRLVGFGRFLRANGMTVGTGRTMTFVRAAAALDPFDSAQLRAAARAALVSRPEDFPKLDALFDRYFGAGLGRGIDADGAAAAEPDAERERGGEESALEGEPEVTVGRSSVSWSPAADDEETDDEEAAIRIVASPTEVLRTKDFAKLTPEERRAMLRSVRQLVLDAPHRSSRRFRPSPRGARFDMRRTLRRSLRTEGEPFSRAWRDRRTRPRPLVLLLDVSGSMAPYSRPLLEFAHAAAAAGRRVEVFVFGTRLTRITRLVRSRDPDAALEAIGSAVVDWEGGTRIGASLKQLLDEWSARSALRGSVVILASDGLERGDPDELATQIARLSRLVHRLVWINPLKGSPRYEPLARGMAAALPHIDKFLPGHNLESLEALAEAVAAG